MKEENLEKMIKEIHWAYKIAEKLIENNPDKRKFVCAAGITPSGKVHIGNFRDIIISELVYRALKDKGYEAELIFSWDDFDRLRKVPQGVPQTFLKYLGMPLSEIPDSYGCHESWAKHFESEFEELMPELGIKARFIYQSQMYNENKYYEGIKIALQNRKEIAEILGKFRTQGMSEQEIESYFPLQVYCRKCRKSTTTRIINYDEKNKIEYKCKCGHHEIVDISKENIGKLSWKIDWPMRWWYEKVDFEPGGADHATSGGSFDVAKTIAKEIYGIEPPLFQGYGFVGIEGIAKMSSSKGDVITPRQILRIYEPELLRWIFVRSSPEKFITLFFKSQIVRQYDEFDNAIRKFYEGELSRVEKREIELSCIFPKHFPKKDRSPFRQIASFGQVVQGNLEELKKLYKRIGLEYDDKLIKTRLEKSQNWIELYMPELRIKLKEKPNIEYFRNLSEEEKEEIRKLIKEMDKYWTLEKLTWLVYEIPKKPWFSEQKKKRAQRNFFKNVYRMLIDADTGPRLPTFLLALGEEKVKYLLEIKKDEYKTNIGR